MKRGANTSTQRCQQVSVLLYNIIIYIYYTYLCVLYIFYSICVCVLMRPWSLMSCLFVRACALVTGGDLNLNTHRLIINHTEGSFLKI